MFGKKKHTRHWQVLKKLCVTNYLKTNMQSIKSFINTGQIQKIQAVDDVSILHPYTTDVIMYKDNNYIEMLKNGKFLYRPSGIGQGKRSFNLSIVEEFMYNQLSI